MPGWPRHSFPPKATYRTLQAGRIFQRDAPFAVVAPCLQTEDFEPVPQN